ncbi:MAG: BlaI/MecI/CopY family transcriptional regulator [Jatrophihabitans sp.]|uniref:BlaI/MecI/CopY family transcriptional regulator n=1 Tax=Jatrophihabitans sp. TaxID=1932789 RepID=UPI003F8192A8
MTKRRASGGLESEVLATLWAARRPLTTAEVVDALGTGLAYNTVQTILTRLHAKGAVQRETAGRAHAYTPVLDDAGLAAARMQAILDRGGDRSTVLARFLGSLSTEDAATLRDLLGGQRDGTQP